MYSGWRAVGALRNEQIKKAWSHLDQNVPEIASLARECSAPNIQTLTTELEIITEIPNEKRLNVIYILKDARIAHCGNGASMVIRLRDRFLDRRVIRYSRLRVRRVPNIGGLTNKNVTTEGLA